MLTQKDGKKLLGLARKTVKNYFENSRLKIKGTRFKEKQGVFVTIHTSSGRLRGCVGYSDPIFPLDEAVHLAAISAAFEDSRFPPLALRELNPELIEAKNPREYLKKIKIGEDGLIVEFGFKKGLLLPQVATEHKLGVEEFLQHTCSKAGLPPDMWMDERTKVYKFQAQIFRED